MKLIRKSIVEVGGQLFVEMAWGSSDDEYEFEGEEHISIRIEVIQSEHSSLTSLYSEALRSAENFLRSASGERDPQATRVQ